MLPNIIWVYDVGPSLRVPDRVSMSRALASFDISADYDLQKFRERTVVMTTVAHPLWGLMRVGIDPDTGDVYADRESYLRKDRFGCWRKPWNLSSYKREQYRLAVGAVPLEAAIADLYASRLHEDDVDDF